MVDTLRRRPWTLPPDPLPEGPGARRISGPIYDLASVKALAHGDRIFLATVRCATDVEDMEWDTDDIAKFIASLETKDFRNSEWCTGSKGQVYDADAYAIYYDPIAECRGVNWQHRKYYIKFGFPPNDPHLRVWVLSCHISR